VKRGMEPKAHCDDMVVHWKATFAKLDIQYDRFFRTTDADHIANVSAVLSMLHERGEIYQQDYTGWYHVGDEIFVTEKDIEDGKYDKADLKEISESNYWFKMGSYGDKLRQHLEDNPGFIQPTSRLNEVKGFLKNTLGDLCISRPKARMPWGIPLPFDEEYVTYVWFDALLNYLTATGYHPDADKQNPPEGFNSYEELWPANFHLVGKDILTTHAVYWSTMLFGMGVPPVQCLYAHGWWTSKDGAKMSKSKGNAIDIDLLIAQDSYGVDATRYFFLREIGFGSDGGFSYDGFQTRYNADLANDLGNLAHRGLSMTTNWLGGKVPALGSIGPEEQNLREVAARAFATFDSEIEQLHFNKALEGLWELVKAGNKYIDTTQPWALNKAGKTEELQTVMRHVLEICFVASALLRCVTPAKADDLLGKLSVTTDQRSAWLKSALAGDVQWLSALNSGDSITLGDPLFPRHKKHPPAIADLFAAEEAAKPAKKPKKAKKPAPPTPDDAIVYDEFAKVRLRVGHIKASAKHDNADKLLVLQVDCGEGRTRQICAGIAGKFSPEELVGRKVVVVANLAPRKIRGEWSEGMLLAAGEKEVVDLLSVDAEPGEVVR